MSIEIPQPDFRSSDLVVVSDRRLQAAEEFKFLFNQVISDPQATQAVRNKDSIFLISSVPFWPDTTKRLKAKRNAFIGADMTNQQTYELSVLDPDGDMSFGVADQDFLSIDLDDDKYAQMILDYFRIQYA